MRHQKAGRKFSRTSEHRHAMYGNMVTSLLLHERIETTEPKAKELKRIDQGIASRMLQHANALLAAVYYTKPDEHGLPRRDAYGRPVLDVDASGMPVVSDATRKAELEKYVGLLDTLRQVGSLLGGGPLGGASGGE